jgi:prepilin-type N-terminal cleavage/methylation domain-containing protein
MSRFRPFPGVLHQNQTFALSVYWFGPDLAGLARQMLRVHSVYSMKTKIESRTQSGFTLIELMIVVGIIALLTTIAVPNLARARDQSRLNMIYSNLRVLDAAKDQWAMENNATTGTPVDNLIVLSSYFRGGGLNDVLHETYVPNPIGTKSEADLPAGVSLGSFGSGATIQLP